MLQVQQAQADGLSHAFVADAQDLVLPPALQDVRFDAVFSNATLHWCKRDPAGVLTSARRVLKPGGRFVIEMGGFTNCVGACHFILVFKYRATYFTPRCALSNS